MDTTPAPLNAPHRTALITGATAGIGEEFAEQLAAQGRHLVLCARDAEALARVAHRLESRYAVHVETLIGDLLTEEGIKAVEKRLSSDIDPVELLINNAGFGLIHGFTSSDWDDERDHWRIHTEIPLRLMHTAIPAMIQRGGGRIINIASIAAFTGVSTYSAAKRAIVEFSEYASRRYKERGVSVTAVCPGMTRTSFHERMNMDVGRVPKIAWLQPEQVVRESLHASATGKALCIPSRRYRLARLLLRFLPASVAQKVVANSASSTKR
ncbi:SDR family oxidoreductase [Pseudoglutamicibacter cumminsii]|uniref:SDR family NAD(P)-dependent oxidoreductase n=1 Tax=Pseudoglutamicibacter cumminsii TaxID=156979 RepID=UPI0021A5D1E2|nr:SDR family NAD(P)-dependent oxidoreductase [Pseudoglutamicibacter cumminsii]MCT1686583.1 SDR family NAD(P)-dependent oxidoreductase [Pseudoglutamicibacter cumminsii]